MLYYDQIDVSEKKDFNKTSASKECDTCHYWYFLDKGFKFQSDVCNGCHGILMMSTNINNFPILNTRGVNYRYIINRISKSEAVNLLQNPDLTEERRVL